MHAIETTERNDATVGNEQGQSDTKPVTNPEGPVDLVFDDGGGDSIYID